MFGRLFSQSGLSLDRLRALVEVAAAGSIVRAATGDLARQSQYSRQIKELEDFFNCPLVERHGKGIRLTGAGRELARISRFFLLGLSNFQRGAAAESQTYRVAAPETFARCFLMPLLARPDTVRAGIRYAVEPLGEEEIERRLHELRLDFGVVTRPELSRPLQVAELGRWSLRLLAPPGCARSPGAAAEAFRRRRLPLAWPEGELPRGAFPSLELHEPALACATFLAARQALEQGAMAAVLPDFLAAGKGSRHWIQVPLPPDLAQPRAYHLAWNPRLLRLNRHARRRRDVLAEHLSAALARPAPPA